MNGKIYKHTTKAVRANSAFVVAPADRLFAVTKVYKNGFMLAWKVTVEEDGVFWHPGFKLRQRAITDQWFKSKLERQGAEPTAYFKPDSFYKDVTAEMEKYYIKTYDPKGVKK